MKDVVIYLGSALVVDGSMSSEVVGRIGLAKVAFKEFRND